MQSIAHLLQGIDEGLVDCGQRPIVVYSALWPVAKKMGVPPSIISAKLIDHLLDNYASKNTIMMPTFTGGFRDGFLDLDSEPSSTGFLSEQFRTNTSAQRTCSAFFSFAVIGPDAGHLIELRPQDAWGDGSVYHWMQIRDALFLMLGTRITHSSYIHRAEWLLRDRIPFRYVKPFSGQVKLRGAVSDLEERLFVRSLSPPARNDFRVLEAPFLQAGIVRQPIPNGGLAVVGAVDMLRVTLEVMEDDVFCCLEDSSHWKLV